MGTAQTGATGTSATTPRSPGELNPSIQNAMVTVPEFAALDAETQIEVTQDIAELVRDAGNKHGHTSEQQH